MKTGINLGWLDLGRVALGIAGGVLAIVDPAYGKWLAHKAAEKIRRKAAS